RATAQRRPGEARRPQCRQVATLRPAATRKPLARSLPSTPPKDSGERGQGPSELAGKGAGVEGKGAASGGKSCVSLTASQVGPCECRLEACLGASLPPSVPLFRMSLEVPVNGAAGSLNAGVDVGRRRRGVLAVVGGDVPVAGYGRMLERPEDVVPVLGDGHVAAPPAGRVDDGAGEGPAEGAAGQGSQQAAERGI